MEDKIQEMESMLQQVKAEHAMKKVQILLEKYNVTVNEEELGILYSYAWQEKDVEWLIKYMENNENSLLKAVVGFHSSWSGSQGY